MNHFEILVSAEDLTGLCIVTVVNKCLTLAVPGSGIVEDQLDQTTKLQELQHQ